MNFEVKPFPMKFYDKIFCFASISMPGKSLFASPLQTQVFQIWYAYSLNPGESFHVIFLFHIGKGSFLPFWLLYRLRKSHCFRPLYSHITYWFLRNENLYLISSKSLPKNFLWYSPEIMWNKRIGFNIQWL